MTPRITRRSLLAAAGSLTVLRSAEPAGNSFPIRDVIPELSRIQKWNDVNGDTADPFWADDDNLYHFSCDGRGFGKEQRNLCFNKLTGPDLLRLKGELVNSMDEYGYKGDTMPDGATWKITGQECIDGVFYGFVSRNAYGDKSGDPQMRQNSFNSSLIASRDRGLTWTRTAKENYDTPMWRGTRFGAPGFIHYGKNGGQVRYDQADRYVYAISNNGFWNNGDDFIVGRVKRADLSASRASDWSYYAGGDGLADGSWSNDLGKSKPVLSRPGKLGWTSPVYVAALNRYLLVSWYLTPQLKKWFEPEMVVYDFFEAEHPWGPWTFVSSLSDRFLAHGQHMYGPNLCAKYQQRNGDDVTISLFTSGCPFDDIPRGLYKNWRIPLTLRTKPGRPVSARVNDDDPAIRYSGEWSRGTAPRAYLTESLLHDHGGDIHYTNQPGAAAEYAFNGSGVELLCEKGPDLGRFDVFLDGKKRTTVDLRLWAFPRTAQIPVFRAEDLLAGPHSIRIVNAGSAYITLDAILVKGGTAKP